MKNDKHRISTQNKFLITVAIISVFLASFLKITMFYDPFVILTIIGSLLIVIITISNDFYRITKLKFLEPFIFNLHIWGILSFLLILPHTAVTGNIVEDIIAGTSEYTTIDIYIASIAFIVLLIMTLTSIQTYQPAWWKQFHKIVWISLPFIAVHSIQFDSLIFGILFILPILMPVFGLILNPKNKNIYFQQIAMIIFGCIILYLTFYHTLLISVIFKWSFLLFPLFMLGVSIFFMKNKEIRKTLLKFFFVALVLTLFIILV
jgi:hypothetical protein